MGNLILAVGGVWGSIINWLSSFNIGYGLVIIIITLALKIILSPIEIYQRISTQKNSIQMAKIQPQISNIEKKYGKNTEKSNQKIMELYKREGVNPAGMCLPMLLTMAVTLVVFITLFSSLNAISAYNIKTEYQNLETTYQTAYINSISNEATEIIVSSDDTIKTIYEKLESQYTPEEIEELKANAKITAQSSVVEKYTEIKEGFLWIKNVYRSDTKTSVFPDAKDYISLAKLSFDDYNETTPYTNIFGEEFTTSSTAKDAFTSQFNEVTEKINVKYDGWNGYYILAILACGVTFLSLWISQKNNSVSQTEKSTNNVENKKNKGDDTQSVNPQSGNKILMVVLPVVMLFFAMQYNSAFALYLVTNSAATIIINLITDFVVKKKREKENLVGKGE